MNKQCCEKCVIRNSSNVAVGCLYWSCPCHSTPQNKQFDMLEGNHIAQTKESTPQEMKTTRQIIASYVERNDIHGLAEFARAMMEDQVLEKMEMRNRVGFLRQWLNEKPANQLVTDEDIIKWLELE